MMMRVNTQRGYVMPGLGTIINTAAIVAGGLLGLLFKNLLTKSMEDTLLKASSVCVLFIGIGGAMSQMLKLTDGVLATSGSMMLIICFVLGGLVGELLNIEGAFERFGAWLRKKTHNESDSGFLSGFIHASLTVCIGAMAIVGSIQDGLLGDASLLCAKAALDAVIILVMTASMGKGCIFSAIPVAILQGGVTLLSRVIAPVPTFSSRMRTLKSTSSISSTSGKNSPIAMRSATSSASTGPAPSPVATKRLSPTWILMVASLIASLASAPVSSRSSTITRKLSNVKWGL